MKVPKLSIIVPVYNVEKYLDECVNSLLSQTLEDIEVILVDDQSPDNCPRICDEYTHKDSRVQVIHKKNAGLGFARNSGLDVAKGEYVTFVDSDDKIYPHAYQKLCNIADKNSLDIVRFECNRFKDDGSHSAERYDASLNILDKPREIRQTALEIFCDSQDIHRKSVIRGGSSCMAIFRRSVIEANQLRFVSEREYISEDLMFCFLFYLCSKKVGWVPNTYYHYRINANSLTRSVRLDRMERSAEYSKAVEQMFLENGFKEDTLHYIWGYYLGLVRVSVKSVFLSELKFSEKRKWFKKQTKNPYFMKVIVQYPKPLLSFKQRVSLWSMKNRLFILAYCLNVGFAKLRKNRFS